MSDVERERRMDVLAMSAQPTMKAPRTRIACVMCKVRLKRSAKVKKNCMVGVLEATGLCRWDVKASM